MNEPKKSRRWPILIAPLVYAVMSFLVIGAILWDRMERRQRIDKMEKELDSLEAKVKELHNMRADGR